MTLSAVRKNSKEGKFVWLPNAIRCWSHWRFEYAPAISRAVCAVDYRQKDSARFSTL